MTITLTFNTWAEYDEAIASIASAFASASVAENEVECGECGTTVMLPYTNPVTGGNDHLCQYPL